MFTAILTRISNVHTFSLASIIAWVVTADCRYREARKLRKMPGFRLRDMGITRKDTESATHRRRF